MEDIIFVASAKWSVLQAALFCPFSAGRRAHCGVGPTATGRLNSNGESRSQNFIYKSPALPLPRLIAPRLSTRGVCMLWFCFCASVPPFILSEHTHTLVSVLMPVSHPSRAGSSCPHIYPLPLCCPARRGDVTDSNKVPFGSICHRGADLPLRIMRP